MCAIAGIFSCRRRPNDAAVKAMAAAMAHRGPDGAGFWRSADGRVAFGHRRLAVIDPGADGAQPMLSADGTLAIVFNGELYNYLELRSRLAAECGARFATRSDTEVILEAWRAWGEGCLAEFNGMFAFALWDERRKVLFLARDRFGEKPLLYCDAGGYFAFASEYRALFTLNGVSAELDDHRLARFLVAPADGLDRGGATVFPAIRQLPPAHWMMVVDGRVTAPCRYWAGDPDPHAGGLAEADAAERFRHLLADSVNLRLRSDVPVGSCLSGGLDSGTVACLVRNQLGPQAPYHVFSGRFPGTPADEGAFIDAVTAAINPIRHEVAPDPARLLEELGNFAWMNELPVDSASQYAQWCVFRLARRSGVVVLLDGQGADEILGGYEQYFAAYLAGAEPGEAEAVRARYPGVLDGIRPWHARLPLPARRLAAHLTGRGSDISFGLRRDLAVGLHPALPPGLLPLHAALRRDALDGFLGTLLRYGDRNSMAHSLEVRLPFCDHRLFEFAQGVAPHLLMGGAQTKRLLREATRGVLPEVVRTRWRKQGFVPPQEIWLRRGLLTAVEMVVADPAFAQSPLWHAKWWHRAISRFKAGESGLAGSLWKLLATEAWRRDFLGRIAGLPRLPALEG